MNMGRLRCQILYKPCFRNAVIGSGLVAKTTVFQNFSGVKHVDKACQYSSPRQTTIYGLRFFTDFLKKLLIAIVRCTGGADFTGEDCQIIKVQSL